MFPQHQAVHVSDLLRERCTGFPCDERSELPFLRSRRSFCHMCGSSSGVVRVLMP